jgi:branched-chain amino acid transport system substrate-binding protein
MIRAFVNCLRLPAVTAVALTLAMQGAAPAADPPYEISVMTSLTGPYAFVGKAEAASIGLVEKNVNASGGVRGRQIKFVIQDDETNPQVAVQLMNGLIAKNVPIVLGPTISGTCGAIMPLLENGPVDFCFSSSVHPPKGSYMYSGNISTPDAVAVFVRYFRERGWKKMALIVTNDASGKDGELGMDMALAEPANHDVTLVAREHYNPTDISIAAQVARIKASGAQVVLIYTAGTPFGTALHGLADAGLDLPVGLGPANLSYAAMHQFASFMPKNLYLVGPPGLAYDALPNGKLKDTVKTFTESAVAAGQHPDIGLIASWDPALIAVAALRQFGFGMTSAQVKGYIDHLHDFPGVYGMYDFRDGSQRGLQRSNGYMVRWDADKDTWVGVSKAGGAL